MLPPAHAQDPLIIAKFSKYNGISTSSAFAIADVHVFCCLLRESHPILIKPVAVGTPETSFSEPGKR